MFKRSQAVICAALLTLTFSVAIPRDAEAGASATLIAMAKPLAEQFGVPGSAVEALLNNGISLESATQLLLVSQSSKQTLGDVTKLYEDSSRNITETAQQLKVDASAYSPEKVQAAIDDAKTKSVASAQEKAADEAGKAVGSALGGFMK